MSGEGEEWQFPEDWEYSGGVPERLLKIRLSAHTAVMCLRLRWVSPGTTWHINNLPQVR